MNNEREHWDTLWRQAGDLVWSEDFEAQYRAIVEAAGPVVRRTVLEAGCGTGMVSMRLAADGAVVTCLDYSEAALEASRRVFARYGQSASWTLADLFQMPFPDDHFDIVWNAGVLEHWTHPRQVAALREMARVCRPGGRVLTLNPNRRCIFYRIGKWVAERTGRWPYGEEHPILSLREACTEAGLAVEREGSVGFLQGLWFLHFVPGAHSLAPVVDAWYRSLPSEEQPLFEGYLLLTACRKPEGHPSDA